MIHWSFPILLMALVILPSFVFAQFRPANTDARLGGFVLRSNGIGLTYAQRQESKGKLAFSWSAEVLNHRHPSEMRIMSSDNFDPGTYVYGKLNHALLLRTGGGVVLNLNQEEKTRKNGVFLQLQAGPQCILLKPVYLRVLNYGTQDDGFVQMERFNENQPQSKELILSEAPFSYGLNETSVRAGFFVKPSLAFEWVNQSGGSRQFELGWCLDFMPASVQLMARQKEQRTYSTFFVAFMIGKTKPPEEARVVF
jgi:hypothetical protein